MNTMIENILNQLQGAQFAALFLDALLKSLVVLALAGGACAVWRSASAATRHLIWLLAVASLPFLPALSSTRPAWQKPMWSISSTAGSANEISLALTFAPKPVVPSAANLPDASKISTTADGNGAGKTVITRFGAQWMLLGWSIW